MPYNPLNFVPSLFACVLNSDLFNYFFVYIFALAFLSTVPIIIRDLISVFKR